METFEKRPSSDALAFRTSKINTKDNVEKMHCNSKGRLKARKMLNKRQKIEKLSPKSSESFHLRW